MPDPPPLTDSYLASLQDVKRAHAAQVKALRAENAMWITQVNNLETQRDRNYDLWVAMRAQRDAALALLREEEWGFSDGGFGYCGFCPGPPHHEPDHHPDCRLAKLLLEAK